MNSNMNSINSKPFAKKTFYLDLKNFPNQAKLVADLKLLGAKEETSLIKSVSFVVSNRAPIKPHFQAPCTPMSNSRSMSPHFFPDSGLDSPVPAGSPAWEPGPRILSRNMLILQQAAKKQGGTTDVIEICKMWNIRIYPLQKVLSWIEKYKNLYYKKHIAEQKKCLKKLPKASEGIQKLQAPFIKIEDAERNYKTRYRVFSSWKNVINPSLSQFVSQLNRNSKTFGNVKDSIRPVLKEVDIKSLQSSNHLSTNRSVSMSKVSACTVSNLISACAPNYGAKENYSCNPHKKKEKENKKKPKKRYCEICDAYFSDLETHLNTKSHETYMNDEKHFSVVKDVISSLPQASDFISSIFEAEEKQKNGELPVDYLSEDISDSVPQFDVDNASPLHRQDDNCMTELYAVNPNDCISASCSSTDASPFPFLEYMYSNYVMKQDCENMNPPSLVYHNTVENLSPVIIPQNLERKSLMPYFDVSEKDAFETNGGYLVKDFHTQILDKRNDTEFSSMKPESNYGSGSNSCDAQITGNENQEAIHIGALLPVVTNNINSHTIINSAEINQNPVHLIEEDIADSVIESVPMCDEGNSGSNLNSAGQIVENELCDNLDVHQFRGSLAKNNDGTVTNMSVADHDVQYMSLNQLILPGSDTNLMYNNAMDTFCSEQQNIQNKEITLLADNKFKECKVRNSETKISTENDSVGEELGIQPLANKSDTSKFETDVCKEFEKSSISDKVSSCMNEENKNIASCADVPYEDDVKSMVTSDHSPLNLKTYSIAAVKSLDPFPTTNTLNVEIVDMKDEINGDTSNVISAHNSTNIQSDTSCVESAENFSSSNNMDNCIKEAEKNIVSCLDLSHEKSSKNNLLGPNNDLNLEVYPPSVGESLDPNLTMNSEVIDMKEENVFDHPDCIPIVNLPSKSTVIVQSENFCLTENNNTELTFGPDVPCATSNVISAHNSTNIQSDTSCVESAENSSSSNNMDNCIKEAEKNIVSCLDLSHEKSSKNNLLGPNNDLNLEVYPPSVGESLDPNLTMNSEVIDMKEENVFDHPDCIPIVNLPSKSTVIVQSENFCLTENNNTELTFGPDVPCATSNVISAHNSTNIQSDTSCVESAENSSSSNNMDNCIKEAEKNIVSCLDLSHEKSSKNNLLGPNNDLNLEVYPPSVGESLDPTLTMNSEVIDMKEENVFDQPDCIPIVNLPSKSTVIVQSENFCLTENNNTELTFGPDVPCLNLSTRVHEILTDMNTKLLSSIKEDTSDVMGKVDKTLNNVVHSTVILSDEASDSATIQSYPNDIHVCESDDNLQCSSVSSSTFKNDIEKNNYVLIEAENLNLKNLYNEDNISSTSVNHGLNLTCKSSFNRAISENDDQEVYSSNRFQPHFENLNHTKILGMSLEANENMEVDDLNFQQTSALGSVMEHNNINSLINTDNAVNFSDGYKFCNSLEASETLSSQNEADSSLFADVSAKYEFVKQSISFETFVNKMQVSPNTASTMWNSSEVFYVLDETNDEGYAEHTTNDFIISATSGAVCHKMDDSSGIQAEFSGPVSNSLDCATNPQSANIYSGVVSVSEDSNCLDSEINQNSINKEKENFSGSLGDDSSSCSEINQSITLPSTNVIQATQKIVHIVYLNSPSQIQKQTNEKVVFNCENNNLLSPRRPDFNSSSSSCKRRLSFSQSGEADIFSSPEKDNTWATIHHEVDSICKSIDSEEDCPLNLSVNSSKHDQFSLLI